MIPKLETKQYKETGLDDLLRMVTDTGPRLLFFGDCPLCPARAGRREMSAAHPWAAMAEILFILSGFSRR